jgi:endonuclease/exonuclease/phosphatase family metal-dependent hydrolase
MLALPQDPRDGERLALIVDLAIAPVRVRIVNTHLTHLRGATDLRRAQAAALMAAAIARAPGPIVLMGDFNAMADDPCLAPIFDHPWLDPAAKAAAFSGITATERLRAGAIDHVLIFDPSRAATLQARRLCLNAPDAAGAFPSDHPGVRAEIILAHDKTRI